MSTDQVTAMAKAFVASGAVVRLAPDAARRRPPEWSTVELRAVEDGLLANLGRLTRSPGRAVEPSIVEAAIPASPKALGDDQAQAVRVLCGHGSAVRLLIAPAGYGKTTALTAAVSAAEQAGRPVVVVAPTHKAVAELRSAGMQAQTVARLRRHLGEGRLAAGTTVVVDEVSQVATRDAAVLMEALACCRDAQLWCVGDARQAQSVAAGGLVVELEALARSGDIAAATLSVNRRQSHPAERAALAAFRSGDVEASQAIRAEHGWEHALDCPAETISALAKAAVADADRHSVEKVAVLATSHNDCEALADAIRSLRAQRGELRGPSLTGPGWASEPRRYAAGDRVLVHANLGRLRNGATGTVEAVGAEAMALRLDDGDALAIPTEVVAGRRPEGTPNLSHAWARTVDGAQGGTWRQVHLLGTAALDRFRGYVGQSRGQLPTHTWNTRAEVDHPAWLVADDRSAPEVVADAMARNEPKSFAAADDPWVLDRQLRAERASHEKVLATGPPERAGELTDVRKALAHAEDELGWATKGLELRRRQRDHLGALRRLRPGGRDDIARADDALDAAQRRLESSERAVTVARTTAAEVTTAMVQRSAWDGHNRWRLARVAEIDAALDHHWAKVTLAAVRADDPLAFGIERLRGARRTYDAELRSLIDAVPPDRRKELRTAEADLSYRTGAMRRADDRVADARMGLEEVERRRWSLRDRRPVERAATLLYTAEGDQRLAANGLSIAQGRAASERQAVEAWVLATRESAGRRRELVTALGQIDDALRVTRPDRVLAIAADPTSDLSVHLGPPPDSPGGLAAWYGIAERIEAWRDRGADVEPASHGPFRESAHHLLGHRPADRWVEWGDLARLADRAGEVIAAATQQGLSYAAPFTDYPGWHLALDEALRALESHSNLDRGRGMEL